MAFCRDCGQRWQALGWAHCAGCCKTFGSESAFTLHQTMDRAGLPVCHDPAMRGLVPRERPVGSGRLVWVRPGEPPPVLRRRARVGLG